MSRKRRRKPSRLSGMIEIPTDNVCADRQELIRMVRIGSHARCVDRVAVCDGKNKIVLKANCKSKAAERRFEQEIEVINAAFSYRRFR